MEDGGWRMGKLENIQQPTSNAEHPSKGTNQLRGACCVREMSREGREGKLRRARMGKRRDGREVRVGGKEGDGENDQG
jgi:hypothetical protein